MQQTAPERSLVEGDTAARVLISSSDYASNEVGDTAGVPAGTSGKDACRACRAPDPSREMLVGAWRPTAASCVAALAAAALSASAAAAAASADAAAGAAVIAAGIAICVATATASAFEATGAPAITLSLDAEWAG